MAPRQAAFVLLGSCSLLLLSQALTCLSPWFHTHLVLELFSPFHGAFLTMRVERLGGVVLMASSELKCGPQVMWVLAL